MIVAIVNQTNPVGTVRVEEFREAASPGDAVTAFVNAYNPPLNPANWLGVDTGWAQYQPPAPDYIWAYDFGTALLVQQAITPEYSLLAAPQVLQQKTLSSPALEEIAGVVAAPSLITPDISRLILRAIGKYRTTGLGSALRLYENGVAISPQLNLPNTNGAWSVFALNTTTSLNAGVNVYTIQGQLGAAVLAELQYVSLNLLCKK